MITIRPYRENDRKQVENICLSTGKQPRLLSKMMLTVFCHYYIEQEPYNCFVAVNEQDEAVGYILCAENFQTWERKFTSLYLAKTHNPITRAVGRGTMEGLRAYSVQYPAHLHIDLAEACQRQGVGTRLMDALLGHLTARGVEGVMLSVAANNEKGTHFYEKYGFRELERTKQEIAMGKRLTAEGD